MRPQGPSVSLTPYHDDFPQPLIMEHETDKIHVMPLGDQWEVEAQSGAPLAHAPSRDEAVETARLLASEQGIPSIVLHDGDGVTEEVSVPPTTLQTNPPTTEKNP